MLMQILQHLVPNAKAVTTGDAANEHEYRDAVQWLDERPQPSWSDVQAARAIVETAATLDAIKTKRHTAYSMEADPLFFEWQRSEGTEQAWRDKVEEIRQRYPDPT